MLPIPPVLKVSGEGSSLEKDRKGSKLRRCDASKAKGKGPGLPAPVIEWPKPIRANCLRGIRGPEAAAARIDAEKPGQPRPCKETVKPVLKSSNKDEIKPTQDQPQVGAGNPNLAYARGDSGDSNSEALEAKAAGPRR